VQVLKKHPQSTSERHGSNVRPDLLIPAMCVKHLLKHAFFLMSVLQDY